MAAEDGIPAITDRFSKLQLGMITVEEAFAYHRILFDGRDYSDNEKGDASDNFNSDESSDDAGDEESFYEDSDDNFDSSSDVDCARSVDSEEDSENDDIDETASRRDSDQNDAAAESITRLIKVGVNDPLLVDVVYEDEDDSFCKNSAVHSRLWAADPGLKFGKDMGFLSQLAHLCIEAKLQCCNRESCLSNKEAMSNVAPNCNWTTFRDWALTAMSCQTSMSDEQKLSRAHTHIAWAVAGCCRILKHCTHDKVSERFRPFLDGYWSEGNRIDLAEVSNLIYWMIKIQSQIGVGPKKFGRWNHRILLLEATMPSIESATRKIESMGICKNRLWNLVNVSDRKQSDLPDIIRALEPHKEVLKHTDHDFCTPSKCQWAQMDSTSVGQLHKCKKKDEIQVDKSIDIKAKGRWASQIETDKQLVTDKTNPSENVHKKTACSQKIFPVELLETAIELGKSTAWLCRSRQLSKLKDPYIAISHVWSDGTGVGVKDSGTVNSCLFDFFTEIAEDMKCKAVWWDAISIPLERKARSKAIGQMHRNYSNARYTIVHDRLLLDIPWRDDGSPCLALVLSTWFTRGWTALELIMSKSVKVLFKNPEENPKKPARTYVIKDLDTEVLAKNPATSSRAHWLATLMIKRLRKPIEDVSDLLAILSPRSTSWARDRTIIAALLAGVPDFDNRAGESIITSKILEYVGKIPHSCLLHGKATMRDSGKYSWCAATLDEMPVETSSETQGGTVSKSSAPLEIDEDGAVEGKWYCRTFTANDVKRKKITPFGNDLVAVVKIEIALRRPENCLLLRQSLNQSDDRALLVAPMSLVTSGPILKCRYIGAVNIGLGIRADSKSALESDTSPDSGNEADDDGTKASGDAADEPGNEANKIDEEEIELHDKSNWKWYTVMLGGKERSTTIMRAGGALDLMDEYTDAPQVSENDESINGDSLDDDGENRSPESHSALDNSHAIKIPRVQWLDGGEFEDYTTLQMVRYEDEPVHLEISNQSLINAIKSMNENAARYLIKMGVVLSLRELNAVALTHPRGVKGIGDIYSKNEGTLKVAIQAYKGVIDGYRKKDECSVDDISRWYSAEYALGSAYTRIRDYKEAEERFKCVLRACQRKSKARETKIAAKVIAKGSAKDSTDDPAMNKLKRSFTTDSKMMTQANQPKDAKDKNEGGQGGENQLKGDHKWYKLQLNTITELTLLNIARLDFDGAADIYRRALHKFGAEAKDMDIEAFEGLWEKRRVLPFSEKGEADEKAAGIYLRALKRFDTIFRKNHLLILITALNLGVNNINRSRYADAESLLMRALNGFVARLGDPLAEDQTALERLGNDEHSIITLTRYYIGMLFAYQGRIDDSNVQLRHVSNRKCSNFQSQVLRLAAIDVLGHNAIDARKPDYNAAKQYFTEVFETCNTLGPLINDYANKFAMAFIDDLIEQFLEKQLGEHFNNLFRNEGFFEEDFQKLSLWEKENILQYYKVLSNNDCDAGIINLGIAEKEQYLRDVNSELQPQVNGLCTLDLANKVEFLKQSGFFDGLGDRKDFDDSEIGKWKTYQEKEMVLQLYASNIMFRAKLGLIEVSFERGEMRRGKIFYEEPSLREMIDIVSNKENNNTKDPFTCDARILVGTIFEEDDDRIGDAETQICAALETLEYLEGKRSPTYLRMQRKLGSVYLKLGKHDEALRCYEDALDNLEQSVGEYDSQTLKVCWRLGRLYLDQGNLEYAEKACERAYQGFNKTAGAESKSTAETAQTLGHVYLQKGSITKAKAMYEQALNAFEASAAKSKPKAKDSGQKQQNPPPRSQDKSTLIAAMDLAKVNAMIPDRASRKKALELYSRAEDGFRSTNKRELLLYLIEAQLKLAGVYRELDQLDDSAERIRRAFDSVKTLRDMAQREKEASKTAVQKDADEKHAECRFRLGQLKLGGYQSSYSEEDSPSEDFDGYNDTTGIELIENSQKELTNILGKAHPLVLEASTVLGIFYLEEAGGDADQGVEMLEEVLNHYAARNSENSLSKLMPGDPKIIRILNSLIQHFDSAAFEDKERVKELEKRKWRQLKSGYGVDVAAMIMEITQSKHLDHEQYDEESEADDDDTSQDSDEEDDEESGDAWDDDDLSSFDSGSDDDEAEDVEEDEDEELEENEGHELGEDAHEESEEDVGEEPEEEEEEEEATKHQEEEEDEEDEDEEDEEDDAVEDPVQHAARDLEEHATEHQEEDSDEESEEDVNENPVQHTARGLKKHAAKHQEEEEGGEEDERQKENSDEDSEGEVSDKDPEQQDEESEDESEGEGEHHETNKPGRRNLSGHRHQSQYLSDEEDKAYSDDDSE
ncbi:hypothetical protein V8C35DRAFT_332409 [Trichoderma chlorosporum]